MSDQTKNTTPENELNERQLFALMTIESGAKEFAQGDLQRALAAQQKAQEELAKANANVAEINGAITGAEVLINRELQRFGVSAETYIRQRDAFIAAERAASEGSKEAPEKSEADSCTECAEPEVTAEAPPEEAQPDNVLPFPGTNQE